MLRWMAGLGLVAVGCVVAQGEGDVARQVAGVVEDDALGPDFTPPTSESMGPVREATIETGSGPMTVKYRLVGEEAVFEGDILLPLEGGVPRSATSVGRQWLDGIVPYVIDANLPNPERVTNAIAHWETKTKLRFRARTTERDYLHFRSGSGCSSNIGQVGGRQTVNLITGEAASSVQAVGVDRSAAQERVTFFYKRGFATRGSMTSANARSNHFRYLLAPGKAVGNLVDVAFAANGHAFAYYDDGTASEGTAEDLAFYAPAKPYALADGETAADVLGFAIDDEDVAYAYYRDGTFSSGSARDVTTSRGAFAVAPGKTPADLAHVDIGKGGQFYAFYNELQAIPDGGLPDGGAPAVRALWAVASPSADALTSADPLKRVGFPGNCTTGSTIHEIGHAVGLYHEQTRHDRDQFVRIVWENIDPGSRFNFEKHSRVVGSDTGTYDFGSIMHYGPKAFSANGQDTIVPLAGGTFAEQREALSPIDVEGVKAMYGE